MSDSLPEENLECDSWRIGRHASTQPQGFIPKIVQDNLWLIDEVITVSTAEAVAEAKSLCCKHGILVGISSGANFFAAKRLTEKCRNVVTVLPDRGERYLSCKEMCR